MTRPRVTVHCLSSLDGRLAGFPADLGLYYELAARLPHQAVLTGSGTLVAAAASQGVDLAKEDDAEPSPGRSSGGSDDGSDTRPLLVIVDSRGRLSRYRWLREQAFWRDVLVLCSAATPVAHLERLRRHQVEHVVLGGDRVDLAAALNMLALRHHVTAVRVDAGGRLNGALFRAGLVDEISFIFAPYLAAGAAADLPALIAGAGAAAPVRLKLTHSERARDGHIWLRYGVGPVPGKMAGAVVGPDADTEQPMV